MDDALAQEAGEFKTLEELKSQIRENLQGMKERDVEAAFERGLLDELIKQNKVELPEGLVHRRLHRLVENAMEDYKRHGAPESQWEAIEKTLHEELASEARRQVHLAFLLDEIAKKENFTAEEKDLKSKYESIADQVRQPVEAVEKYYAGDEDAR